MKKDIDYQFLCKDCERYGLCKYYHNRKEDSYICKYFHSPNKLDILNKIKSEVLTIPQIDSDGHNNNWYREPQAIIDDVLQIIDKHIGSKE